VSQHIDPDKPHQSLVSHHGPVRSEPVAGHEATSFEATDAKAGVVVSSLAIIGGTLVVVFAMTIGIEKILDKANPPGQLPSPVAPARVLPPSPQLQVHPWDELPDLHAHEDQVLNSFGKDAAGHVHIPIDQAVNATPGRLSIAPGAPQGVLTPGGEGRDFSGSLSNMPAPYRKPAIEGEIRKAPQ
jgi:hypothetical protein